MTATRWLALESNPESMCKWAASLGLDIKQYSFNDVYGFDEISLSWVNKPCKAVLMLFPITFAYEQLRKKEDERILNEGVKGVEDIIFFKQRIANACGTIALLHALANAGIKLEPGILTELFTRCKGKSPIERAALLETSDDLSRVHDEAARTGQTETPNLADEVDLHFVAFVNWKGNLIELDGRRNSPINHGPIAIDLLESAVEACQKVIAISDSLQFNLITLGPTPAED